MIGINRGKRGLALDLQQPAGRALMDALLPIADVVLMGFRPSVDSRLGLSPDQLGARKPRIASITFNGYGAAADYADLLSFDPLSQALSVQVQLQGGGAGPVFFTLSLNDFGAGFLGLLYALCQLWRREESGRAGEVELTQASAALALIADQLVPGDAASRRLRATSGTATSCIVSTLPRTAASGSTSARSGAKTASRPGRGARAGRVGAGGLDSRTRVPPPVSSSASGSGP